MPLLWIAHGPPNMYQGLFDNTEYDVTIQLGSFQQLIAPNPNRVSLLVSNNGTGAARVRFSPASAGSPGQVFPSGLTASYTILGAGPTLGSALYAEALTAPARFYILETFALGNTLRMRGVNGLQNPGQRP